MTSMPPSSDFDPSAVAFPEAPARPKAVGIISIVWGALGLGCAGCGLAGIGMLQFAKGVEDKMGPMPPAMMPGSVQIALMVLGVLLAVVLIIAGIFCITRKPVARPAHLFYAVCAIATAAAGTVMGINQQAALQEWMRQNPTSEWAKGNNPALSYGIMAFTTLLGLAWPAFCLIWFGVIKRRAEDMTGGVESPAA